MQIAAKLDEIIELTGYPVFHGHVRSYLKSPKMKAQTG